MSGKLGLWLIAVLVGAWVGVMAEEYALARDGKAVSCIVLSPSAGVVEQHAASELALWIEKVTGATVSVRNAPEKGSYSIYLGTAETTTVPRSAAIAKAIAQLNRDGYVLAADREGVRVIGKRPVGVLYGVYGLLKQYADVRWFHPGPDGEYCPKQSAVVVPEQVTVHNPSFQHRELGFICANVNSKIVSTWDWMVRNGLTIQMTKHVYRQHQAEFEKRGAVTHDGGHCFAYLLSDSLFDDHPEYFPLMEGKRTPQEGRKQPCTSNLAVAEIMSASIGRVLDSAPHGRHYLIGNNDATLWCQCASCAALDPPAERQKGFVSTRYHIFVNRLVSQVYAARPDADLWAWAYQNFQMPPVGVAPDKRLSIEACVHHRCYRHSLADETCLANAKFRDMLTSWRKLGLPVKSREYNETLPGDPAYVPFERVFCQDLKYYHSLGMTGFRLPIPPPDGKFGPLWNNRRTLNAWYSHWQALYLAALLGWDIKADYGQAVEDMGAKYYGPAWPVMRQYRELLTRTYEETPGDIVYGTPDIVLGKCLERPNVQSKLNQLLAEAVKAAAGDEAVLKRIKRDQDYFAWCWEGTHQEYLSKRPRETYAGKCTGKVAVDGKFDDEDWKKVDFTTHFIVNDGKTLADPQTYVKMLYDADHLYFAVDAMEPQRDKSKRLDAKTRIELRAACVARDGPQIWADSTLEFFIAVPEMKGQYYQIAVNPIGTIYDSLCSPSQAADLTFDSKAEVKATVLPDRWTVEARIPTAALGRRIQDGETWKVNVGRSRKLTDGTRQASSWSNGAFHGPDAYRPVVFGGTPLIKNGDFEDVVKASEKVKNPAWQFADDLAPAHWSFTERGTGAVIVGDAASGRRFYRGQGWIFQLVNLSADFRGRLLIRLKTRGKGSLRIAFFQYDRKTSRILGVAPVRTEQVDSPSWSPIEATHDCADDKVLRLAFRLQDDLALDDVSVTPDKRAVAEP